MRKRILKIAITTGDPAGIGPEVALKAVSKAGDDSIIPVLIGSRQVLEMFHGDLCSGFEAAGRDALNSTWSPGMKYIIDVPLETPLPVQGRGTPGTGLESRKYIDLSVDLWERGVVDAIVTAPVSKECIELSGTPFTGHTGYMAGLIGEKNPLMMMYSERFRVLLVTTHIPLSGVTDAVTGEHLLRVIESGYRTMCSIDGEPVKIAVAGLDPHCGDGGAVGDFDMTVTRPAVEKAKASGIPVEGPFAADTLFIPERWEEYNLIIAQYHDQGLVPFKMLSFDTGVNVTLGLSLTRTSVDHGTAFDIAGRGVARYRSMIEAIRVARLIELKKETG